VQSATATLSPSGTIGATAGANSEEGGQGKLEIEELLPQPNPNPAELRLKMDSDADEATFEIFGVAMACQWRGSEKSLRRGWASLPLPGQWRMQAANGVYYVRVVLKSGERQSRPKTCKILILK
jgi:hypothetical protein